jgi:hypothetical protein
VPVHQLNVAQAGRRDRADHRYQRWSPEADPLVITAFGQYHALFAIDGRQLRLTHLTVARDWQRS